MVELVPMNIEQIYWNDDSTQLSRRTEKDYWVGHYRWPKYRLVYILPFWYGYCSLQCLAILSRLVTHTSPCGLDDRYSTKRLRAMNRPALPMMRQCRPMVIIFGVPAYPSASRTSKADWRYSKNACGEKAPVVL